MINVIIIGYLGKMGQSLLLRAPQFSNIKIVDCIGKQDNLALTISNCDVVIDFSNHSSTTELVNICCNNNKPIVIGTTGHFQDEEYAIRQFGTKIPIMWSSNYSCGMNVLFWLTKQASRILDEKYIVTIEEQHHASKIDVPSGSAKSLKKIIASCRNEHINIKSVRERELLWGFIK